MLDFSVAEQPSDGAQRPLVGQPRAEDARTVVVDDGVSSLASPPVVRCTRWPTPVAAITAMLLAIHRLEPANYERAARRWIAMLCEERRASVDLLGVAQAAAVTIALALGTVGDPAALPALTAALQSPVTQERCWAADTVRRIGDRSGSAALRPVLDDPDPGVRLYVIKALGRLKDREALLGRIAALEDRHRSNRAQAAEALAAVGDVSAAPALRAAYERAGFYEKLMIKDDVRALCE